jgi:hypothetical protein
MNTQKIKVVLDALKENANADWSKNDPSTEFQALADILEEASKPPSERERHIALLGEMVSEDDVAEAYDKLLAQAEIDGDESADGIISMWEPLENRYTVSQLLSELH